MRFLCVAVAVAACARPAVQAPRLATGSSVERAIASGETHHYDVELAEGAVLVAAFDQLGADVVVTTFDPSGAQIDQIDSPTGGKGTEHVRIDARRAGTYRIEVTTLPGPRGSYRARVVEIVTARELAAREAKERAAAEAFFAERQPFVDEFVEWARGAAIGDDFAGLERVIGNARVIALGEADHGVHEYLAYRNRLARHLIERHGVTAILVESGFTEATVADDYVQGIGTATSREAAAALFSSAMPATLADNLELVEWLRAYNTKAARKVHIYGIDVTGRRNGIYVESRRAADAALAYLAQHAPATHARLEPQLAPLLAKFHTAGYLELGELQRVQLTGLVAELLGAFKPLPDTAPMRRARQSAAMAAVLDTFFRQTRDRSSKQVLADASLDGIRDATMAANVIWALDQDGPSSRAFLVAHNSHVRRAPATTWPVERPPIVAMGEALSHSLRQRLVVIGFLHGDGPPSATLDGLFAKVGRDSFVLDLRDAPDAVRAGLDEPWRLRLDHARALGLDPWWSARPRRCFDALAYSSKTREAAYVR
jgi:erythromycin esterase